mmetsp:Transcript_99252/g.285551  ORF Transcript_99252/g.285551 Transcript_99252/m.285551 type:complete len:223 (-) Transcript_99252:687-1355(-)
MREARVRGRAQAQGLAGTALAEVLCRDLLCAAPAEERRQCRVGPSEGLEHCQAADRGQQLVGQGVGALPQEAAHPGVDIIAAPTGAVEPVSHSRPLQRRRRPRRRRRPSTTPALGCKRAAGSVRQRAGRCGEPARCRRLPPGARRTQTRARARGRATGEVVEDLAADGGGALLHTSHHDGNVVQLASSAKFVGHPRDIGGPARDLRGQRSREAPGALGRRGT